LGAIIFTSIFSIYHWSYQNINKHSTKSEKFKSPIDRGDSSQYHFPSFGLTTVPRLKIPAQTLDEGLTGTQMPICSKRGEALESTNVEGSG
jgi:hypothetical protein